MSDEAVLKEGIDQSERMALQMKNPFKEVGKELVKTGESIEIVSQTMIEVNDVLKNIAEVMEEIGKVMHEADDSLHTAGGEINRIQVPKVAIRILKIPPYIDADIKEVPVFGPTGDALVKAGDRLHEIGERLDSLEKSIEKLSKPKGSLDNLSTDVLHPLGIRLKYMGAIFNSIHL